MTPKYQQFIFEDYIFDTDTQVLSLHYSFDGTIHFTENFHFDFPLHEHDASALDRAFQLLFFMAGVSYYKAYLAPEIVVKKGWLDQPMADFYAKTYQRGLGEFFYINQLDPKMPITFPVTSEQPLPATHSQPSHGILIGLGGGKDSLLSVELVRNSDTDIATWSLNHRPQLTPLVERIGLPHYFVEREWDPSLIQHNAEGALNGHIPISAILAACGVIVAILTGREDVSMSNELSANEPTLVVDGVAINHQYSKTSEFEVDFQELLAHAFANGPRYYSFLRPLSELHIAELFCKVNALRHYEGVFSSCNRAYVHGSNHIFWDGTCPKCAFFFLAMAPFAETEQLTAIFDGKNLLHDPELEQTYRQVLGIAGDKPLDCIGEIKESRTAMRLIQTHDVSLRDKYSFDIPDSYDYRALGGHHMPPEVYTLFSTSLQALQSAQPE
jgi:hypothetical protein